MCETVEHGGGGVILDMYKSICWIIIEPVADDKCRTIHLEEFEENREIVMTQ